MTESAKEHISENTWFDIGTKTCFALAFGNDVLERFEIGLEKVKSSGAREPFIALYIEQKDF